MRKLILGIQILLLAVSEQVSAQTNAVSPPPAPQCQCTGIPGACGYNPNHSQRIASPNPSPLNGNTTLGQSFLQQDVCGLAYLQVSLKTSTRYPTPVGAGFPASLNVAGLPPCFTIVKAFVYWGISYTEAVPPASNATITNPVPSTASYPATVAGTAGFVCWGETGTATYRADVTPSISGNGAYSVNVSGFANANSEIDGITLIIIYTSPQTWTGSIVLYDGCMSNSTGASMTYTGTGFNVCAATNTADAFGVYGDRQSNINANVNTDTYNGSTASFANNFWEFNDIPTTLTAAQSTLLYNSYTNNSGDCWLWSLAGLYWQNTGCVVCSSSGLTLTTTAIAATCSNCNGSATVSVAPAGAYTYTWSPAPGGGQGTPTATGLCPGTYTVTVNSGCNTGSQTIIVPNAGGGLTVTNASQTNVLCNGQCNGSATASVTGGTPPYTYSWSPSGGSGPTASGLCVGSYTCNVTDANGCTGSLVFNITQPTPLSVTTSFVTATCGNPNGSATVSVTGGTPPYTYSWSPVAGAGPTLSNIPAGAYTCTITDAHGCTITVIVNVPNSGGPTVTMGAVVNVTCNGACNGSATVNATGGAPPLTYNWVPNPTAGQGTPTASSLCPGLYSCTVTDASGCAVTVSATITQPPLLVVTATHTNEACFSGCTATGTSTVTGGTPPYTYAWTPAGGNGPNASALCAGTFTVTVTDANGCTANTTITVTQPAQLTVVPTSVNVTCNGACNGSLNCTPGGGTPPYTYSWSGGCLTQACANVCPGTYTITLTDANGCTVTGTTTITQPAAMVLTMSSVTAHCNQSDGSAAVNVTGGSPGYTYAWHPGPGSATSAYNAIPPGTYTVVVTDLNGCKDSNTVVVGNIPGVIASIPTNTPPTCFGGTDGTATGAANAGTAPYTYSWNPGGQTTITATNLAAGTYTLTVTDATGCLSTATVTLTAPGPVAVVPMAPVTQCIGQCTALTATASGGTGPYNYAWTNNATPVTSPVCPVVTTTYTVVATDAHLCASPPMTVTITVNPPLEITASGTASICPGKTTPLTTVATGGSGAPYTYSWSPGPGLSSTTVANPSASPAITTTYTVVLTDNCGTPSDSATVVVTVLPSPVITLTAIDTAGCAPLCVKFNCTSVPACASVNWTFGDLGTGTGCGSLTHCYTSPGQYSVGVTLTDINGCISTLNKPNWITVYPLPVAHFTDSPQPTTILNNTIHFQDMSVGATTWNWSFGDLAHASSTLQNPQYTYPDTGCFEVQLLVTNANGCRDSVTSPVCIGPDFIFYAPNAFTPNGDGRNDLFTPQGIGIDANHYKLMIFDRWGNLIWSTTTWGQGWDGKANNGNDGSQIDTYVWKVDLKDVMGNKHSYIGHISIIR